MARMRSGALHNLLTMLGSRSPHAGRIVAPLAAALALLTLASDARAARFGRCPERPAFECTSVRVPLDRSGRVRGTIGLHVQRLISSRRHRRALMFFAGGPGQAATPFAGEVADEVARSARRHQFVVFDQRGTGRSGALDCPLLQRLGDVSGASRAFAAGVGDCGSRLGARRAFYGTTATLADIESVRRAIRADKLTLYGVSYGTYVAERYALAHPTRVDRLVLDSVVPPAGVDDFQLSTFAAAPRVLRALCARRACRSVTGNPVGDVAALVARLRTKPVRGVVITRQGSRRPAALSTSDALLDVLADGDLNDALRAGFPAAVRSALAGDAEPLLRLAAIGRSQPADRLAEQSDGLFVATTCSDTPLPWPPLSPLAGRATALRAAAAALAPRALAPFDSIAAMRDSIGQECLRWPPTGTTPPSSRGRLPNVPALLLAGQDDLRTPVEDAARVAATLPRARLVTLAGTGHDVEGSDNTGCVSRAVRNFLRGRQVRRCRRANGRSAITPIAPTTIDAVAPIGLSGRPGRTLRAVNGAIADALFAARALSAQDVRPVLGGLRGGTLRAVTDMHDNPQRLTILRYIYVPGVHVSGDLVVRRHVRGKLQIGGSAAARGWLRFHHDGTVSGRLGGRAVRRVRVG
jgi:pimeloyl-ACP methyl ester carboxylesterase